MLNRTITVGLRPTVLIGEGERKFASKLKSGENNSYMGAYGEIIPEHSQFEHVKHRIEIWSDIFKHTDRRIAVNQEKILNIFNKNPSKEVNDDSKVVEAVISKDIAYPINFKKSKSFWESYMATKKLKQDLKNYEK